MEHRSNTPSNRMAAPEAWEEPLDAPPAAPRDDSSGADAAPGAKLPSEDIVSERSDNEVVSVFSPGRPYACR